jgi:hypothetical protein
MTKQITNRATIAGEADGVLSMVNSMLTGTLANDVRPLEPDETMMDAWGMRGDLYVYENSILVSELGQDQVSVSFDFESRGGAPIALFDFLFDKGYFVALYSFDEVEFIAYEFTNGQLNEFEVPQDSRIVSREVPHRVNRVLGLTERVASLMEMAE